MGEEKPLNKDVSSMKFNKEEMEKWLGARHYKEVEIFDYEDPENYYEYFLDGENQYYLLSVNMNVFDENKKLKAITQDDWNEDWVVYTQKNKIIISEDDLPF